MKSTNYRIAQVLISVEAPYELNDSNEYSLYRVEKKEDLHKTPCCDEIAGSISTGEQMETVDRYVIRMVEDTAFTLPKGEVLFQNQMHLFLEKDGEILHFFKIPLTQHTAAWCETTGKLSLTIRFRPFAETYFKDAFGCFNAASIEYIMFLFRKFMFHCSYVDVGGQAVLFSAHSGGGKTTHALLWEKTGLGEMINGDRAVIEKINNNRGETVKLSKQKKGSANETSSSLKKEPSNPGTGFMVHGLPIAGSSNVYKNRSLPLRAIFMLEKAPINEVVEITPSRLFLQVFEQITVHLWDREFVRVTADFVTELITNIPVRLLRCRPDEGAVHAVRNALKLL